MKIRLRFSKGTPLKFISHLDLQRLFIRAFRRARLPMSYKEGFNPQPKLSFASALSLGYTSSGEYLAVEIEGEIEPGEVQKRLSQQLPMGISITEADEVPNDAPSLMAQVKSFLYRVKLESAEPLSIGQMDEAVNKIMNREELWISKSTKKGTRQINIIPYMLDLKVIPQETSFQWEVEMHLKMMSPEGTVKPVEIMKVLEKETPFKIVNMDVHREAIII